MLTQNKAITLQEYCDAFTDICYDTAITINNANLSKYVGIDTDEDGLPISYNQCIRGAYIDEMMHDIIYYNDKPANVCDMEGTFYTSQFTPTPFRPNFDENKLLIHNGSDFIIPSSLFMIMPVQSLSIRYNTNTEIKLDTTIHVWYTNNYGEGGDSTLFNFTGMTINGTGTSQETNYDCFIIPYNNYSTDAVFYTDITITPKIYSGEREITNSYFYETPLPYSVLTVGLRQNNNETLTHYENYTTWENTLYAQNKLASDYPFYLGGKYQIELHLNAYLTETTLQLNQHEPYDNTSMGATIYYEDDATFWDSTLSIECHPHYRILTNGEMKINWSGSNNLVKYMIVKAYINFNNKKCDFHILYEIDASNINIPSIGRSYIAFNMDNRVSITNNSQYTIGISSPTSIQNNLTPTTLSVNNTLTYYEGNVNRGHSLFLSTMYYQCSTPQLNITFNTFEGTISTTTSNYGEINDIYSNLRSNLDNGHLSVASLLYQIQENKELYDEGINIEISN